MKLPVVSDFLRSASNPHWVAGKRQHYLDLVKSIDSKKDSSSAFSLEKWLDELKRIGWSAEDRRAILDHTQDSHAYQFFYELKLPGLNVGLGRRYSHHVQLSVDNTLSFRFAQLEGQQVKASHPLGNVKGFEYLASAQLGIFERWHKVDKDTPYIDVMQQNLPFIARPERMYENDSLTERGVEFFNDLMTSADDLLEVKGIHSDDVSGTKQFFERLKKDYSTNKLSLYSSWCYT